MPTEAVLFDLDGVLINSECLKAEAWRRILSPHSVPNGDQWYKARIGTPRMDLCKEAVRVFGLNIAPEVLYEKKVRIYREIARHETRPIANSIRLVKALAARKIQLGVVSSQHRSIIMAQLQLAGINACFALIVSGEDDLPEGRGKPNPDIYLLAARRFCVEPHSCIAVEDTTVGILSAKRAGMYCIGFQNPESGEQDLSRADAVVMDLSTLDLSLVENASDKME